MKSLYESKNSYLSCGLQLEQKKLLTKLIWEQLDRFKRMNSTLETTVKSSNCNNLSSTHLKSSPKWKDYLYLLFLGVCFKNKGSLVFGWKWFNMVSNKVQKLYFLRQKELPFKSRIQLCEDYSSNNMYFRIPYCPSLKITVVLLN